MAMLRVLDWSNAAGYAVWTYGVLMVRAQAASSRCAGFYPIVASAVAPVAAPCVPQGVLGSFTISRVKTAARARKNEKLNPACDGFHASAHTWGALQQNVSAELLKKSSQKSVQDISRRSVAPLQNGNRHSACAMC